MKTLIFVGGASATGKSTFARELQNRLNNSIVYRRVQSFYDIAKEKNISEEMMFKKITSDDVDDYFLTVCKSNDFVISDVHYAIQMGRNKNSNDIVDIHQEYVPTISESLVKKLQNEEINIIALCLYCSPQMCLNRAKKRFENHERELRAKSLEDVELEILAERKQWNVLTQNKNIVSININTENIAAKDLAQEFIDFYINNLNNKNSKSLTLTKK